MERCEPDRHDGLEQGDERSPGLQRYSAAEGRPGGDAIERAGAGADGYGIGGAGADRPALPPGQKSLADLPSGTGPEASGVIGAALSCYGDDAATRCPSGARPAGRGQGTVTGRVIHRRPIHAIRG